MLISSIRAVQRPPDNTLRNNGCTGIGDHISLPHRGPYHLPSSCCVYLYPNLNLILNLHLNLSLACASPAGGGAA
jgi:hypothetical protein